MKIVSLRRCLSPSSSNFEINLKSLLGEYETVKPWREFCSLFSGGNESGGSMFTQEIFQNMFSNSEQAKYAAAKLPNLKVWTESVVLQ